jgi:hypothetical protein
MRAVAPAAPLSARLKRPKPSEAPPPTLINPPPTWTPPVAPPGPCRVKILHRKGKLIVPIGAVSVVGREWSSPFRIRRYPAGRRPFQVTWSSWGMGAGRPVPQWFEPDNHADRRAAQEECHAALELWLESPEQCDLLERIRRDLQGKALACRCGRNTSCHADTMLRIANATGEST